MKSCIRERKTFGRVADGLYLINAPTGCAVKGGGPRTLALVSRWEKHAKILVVCQIFCRRMNCSRPKVSNLFERAILFLIVIFRSRPTRNRRHLGSQDSILWNPVCDSPHCLVQGLAVPGAIHNVDVTFVAIRNQESLTGTAEED